MDLLSVLSYSLTSCASDLYNLLQIDFDVIPAKKKEFGDFSTNIAFVLANQIKSNPIEIAKKISEKLLSNNELIEKVEVASGGFINIYLKVSIWQAILEQINTQKQNFGFEDIGKGEQIHIEFVSANPTGPLHLGHIRGAVIFDTLSELLKKSNFSVVREYYINDAGNQIEILMQSIFLRYQEKITGNEIKNFPPSCYPGDYIKDIAVNLESAYGRQLLNYSQEQFNVLLKDECISYMMSLIKADLAKLKIFYDYFVSEDNLQKLGYVEKSIALLKERGCIEIQELEQPKGDVKNWEKREQLVFLAKNFGDDENRSLQKSDKTWTYFASDLAYHFFKIERGFNKMIIGLGADHSGYVKRLKGLVKALSDDKANINVKLYNIVNLFENGQPIKLSKRSGNIITLDDVVEKNITPQEVRFIMLTKCSDVVLDFDIAKFLKNSDDNPIFYVQYASARCSSVLRKYTNDKISVCDAQLFKTDAEWDLIETLAKWPNVIKVVIQTFQVHKIVFYAQEVAEKFHSLWNLGMKNPKLKFIIEDNPELTKSRIFLVQATKYIISSVLGILKIEPLDHM